jgi:hypothetical protein
MREELTKLDQDIIENFRNTGNGSGIPQKMQDYILQLDRSIELYRYDGNISRCAGRLRKEFCNISFNTARNRIYDAINLFHLNNSVRNEAWDNFYADKMEDLSRLAIASNDVKSALNCLKEAHRLRTMREDDGINKELLAPPTFIMSNDISVTDLNIEDRDMRKISKKYNKKEYARMINSLPIEDDERERLKQDADITDVDFEDVNDG